MHNTTPMLLLTACQDSVTFHLIIGRRHAAVWSDILEDTPTPKQEPQLCSKSLNKDGLQFLAHTLDLHDMKNITVRGMVVNKNDATQTEREWLYNIHFPGVPSW